MMKKVSYQIIPYVRENTMVGIIPGNGGGEFAFKDILKKRWNYFWSSKSAKCSKIS